MRTTSPSRLWSRRPGSRANVDVASRKVEPLEPNEQQAVGRRLRAARETLGLTQEDVAGALGIQRTSVIAMEAGKRNVSALELRRLARLYRRSVAWILGEDDESEHAPEDDRALYRAT